MKKITVIGCGVIGLTTAIQLERAGYDVRIITRNLHFKTTSAIAAAIWLPFKAEPPALVNRWSLETYHILEQESKDPITGVKMVDFHYLSQKDEMPPWEAAIPATALRKAQPNELPADYQYGYIARVPLIETPIYLEFLFDEFRGEIILDEVLNFAEIEQADHLIINCTGLGAKALTEDKALYPVKGQLIKMEAHPDVIAAADDHPDHFFYIIPRSDCIILGGTTEAEIHHLDTDAQTMDTIFDRSVRVEPKLKDLAILKKEAGLRPYRSSIRLEKEAGRNIIHNYGHGGSGFTVCWACAAEVQHLVEQA